MISFLKSGRTSLHSLLYGKPTSSLLNDMIIADTYIPDDRWIFLTVILIIITICISLVIPHIEMILGLVGSTTGTTVCFILPALFFINLTARNTRQRLLAFSALYFGIMLLVFSTFTLLNVDQQELSNQGQIMKNLNLSTNRLEKLIEENKLNQIKKDKGDLPLKKDTKLEESLNDKMDESVNKKTKTEELVDRKDDKFTDKKTKDDKATNERIQNDKNLISNKEKSLDKLKDINKNDQKDNNTIDKSRSGFINAVEKNRKNLSREKLEPLKDNLNKSMTNKLNNQSKLESKLDKTINKNLTNSKVVKDSKFLDKKVIDKKPVKNKTIDKDRDFKK